MHPKAYLFAVIILLANTLPAQDTIFFDADWERTSEANATYYHLEYEENGFKSFADYYKANDQKQNVGFFQDDEKHGQWLYWDENGLQTVEENWNEGLPNGAFREWWPNGDLQKEAFYDNGLPTGVWTYQDIGDTPIKVDASQLKQRKGQPLDLSVAPVCQNMGPIKQSIGYPSVAIQKTIEGKVIVRVKVDKQGKVIGKEIERSAHEILDNAVLAKVDGLKFTPATYAGTPISFFVSIPFDFKLLK